MRLRFKYFLFILIGLILIFPMERFFLLRYTKKVAVIYIATGNYVVFLG